ncbi:SOS response-associated peptidase family protein [Maribacter sp. 2307UL18-2]|uniref:SOS response-associated peptidase family protein n=1 Tax=Maribacter sp. 2307UL18-2 TaxID=3386274 RepID=UPI0039BC4BF2
MSFILASYVERVQIEDEFNATTKFPNIYTPTLEIHGAEESLLTVVSDENIEAIDYAIWGILPETWTDDWDVFQKATPTLHFSEHDLKSNLWYTEAYEKRRCLVIVSGYYTHFLSEGRLYPFYMCRKSGKPFCLAGIYNRLDDGFLTASILTAPADKQFLQIHNIGNEKPVYLPDSKRQLWLDSDTTLTQILEEPTKSTDEQLIVYPISSKRLGSKKNEKMGSIGDTSESLGLSGLQHILTSNNIDFKN